MPKLLTIPEVMKALRVSRATIYRLMANDALPFVKIRRRTLVSRDALDAFIQRQQQERPVPDDDVAARRTSGRIVNDREEEAR
jgi:excisionase family DNA binding protein